MDKGNPKRANGVLTCGSEDIPLEFGPNISVVRKLVRKRKKRKRKEREEEGRKRSSTFSLVFSAIGPSIPCWSKKESSSSWKELQVETEIEGFRQTSRGRSASPTRFIFGLRAIQMA